MVAGVMSDPARNSPPPMTDESVLSGLDKDQRAVAVDVAGPLAVLAGAGTGKTRAITHRIAHAVLSGAQAPDSILAVTFTTRAAGEMRARLATLGVPRVQARTFHSAALRQIRYFWPRRPAGSCRRSLARHSVWWLRPPGATMYAPIRP